MKLLSPAPPIVAKIYAGTCLVSSIFICPVVGRSAGSKALRIRPDQAINADMSNFARRGREGGSPLSHPLAAIPGLHPIRLCSSPGRASEAKTELAVLRRSETD